MAGVKTAIGHHSPSSAPTPAKGGPANQAAPPQVWDSSSRRGSGMERSVSRRGGRGAWARPEPRCPQGSACAPHRPRAHRVVTRGLWHWTRAAELREERVPGGLVVLALGSWLNMATLASPDAPEGFRRRRHDPARGGGRPGCEPCLRAAQRGRALRTGVRGTEARAPVLAQNLRSPRREGAAWGGPRGMAGRQGHLRGAHVRTSGSLQPAWVQ